MQLCSPLLTAHVLWLWMRRLKATDQTSWHMTPLSQSIFPNAWTHTRHCIGFQSRASEQMPAQLELWLLLRWAQYLTLWMMSLLPRLTIRCSPITCCRWLISDVCNCRIQLVNLSFYTYVGGESKLILERVYFKQNATKKWIMFLCGAWNSRGVLSLSCQVMSGSWRWAVQKGGRSTGTEADSHHLNGVLDMSSRTFVRLVLRDVILD